MNIELGHRVREIRLELYGLHGGPMLASELGISFYKLMRYEQGQTIPAHTILLFMEKTGARSSWLFTGEGEKYEHRPS
jgi:hypothetical protein